MSENCIFCRIIRGELPCEKVYEDEHNVAFLDIAPVRKGHTLVIPKAHHERLYETPAPVLQRLMPAVARVARALVHGLEADGMNITQANGPVAGQVVPHVHVHLVPRFASDAEPRNWHPGAYADRAEMAEYGARIRAAVKAD